MTTTIYSNGSKWAGDEPDTIDTLVRLLERDGCHLADDVVDYTSDWID